MKFVPIIGLAALAAATALPATDANAAEVELRLSHWVPATHPLQPTGLEPWAKSIAEASGDRIHITIFPAQQLGAAPDHYDMTRDGITDIGFINPGYQAGRFPVIAAGEIPFTINNAKAGSRAFDSWYRQYAEKEMPDVYYCMAFVHDPGALHSKVKITSPDQIAGMNIRPAHATMGRFINMLGGSNVQVSAPEAREAIAKGAADAITFPWNSIYIFGIDGVTKEHLDMPFYTTTFVLAFNKAKYDGMSEEDRKVIDDHCTSEWAEKMAAGWADWEAKGREKMKADPSHHLNEPTAEEVAAWRRAAEPLLAAWKKDVSAKGFDADAVHQSLMEKLKANDSLYE